MGTLIGRERQLQEVQDFVEGGSGLVLVLGKPCVGKRLFLDGRHIGLTLVEATPLPTGVVFMRYRRG